MSDPRTPAPLVAPLLLGRYRPHSLIARGGSARVYLGKDMTLGRDVAIKVFNAGVNLDGYREEIELLARLSHHGVVSIVDAGIDDSSANDPRPFLVMELIRGRTLRATLAQHPLSSRQVSEMAFEVAEALDYVHAQGVVHRDVTPANIMLTDYGTPLSRPRARLTDFGIAVSNERAQGPTGLVEGTTAYLSPEQAADEPLTSATDIYSLGLVMLESFTGERSFATVGRNGAAVRVEGEPVIPKNIGRSWRTLIKDMTRERPFDRPTALEVGNSIRANLRQSSRPGGRTRLTSAQGLRPNH